MLSIKFLSSGAMAERTTFSIWGMAWNLMLLTTMVGTNMLALYSLSVSRSLERTLFSLPGSDHSGMPNLMEEVAHIREEIRNTQRHLLQTQADIHSSQKETQKLFSSLPSNIAPLRNRVGRNLLVSSEFLAFTEERPLPLGRNPTHGAETMTCPVGHTCFQHRDLLDRYMNYTIGALCPDDWSLGQALMVRGCEPLPRRRCFARSPTSYSSPLPLPQSMWTQPPDDTIRWTHYTCKSFDCLNRRARESKVFVDCADCFELQGPERNRWVILRDRADVITVDEILALKKGTIRIGLDIGGGTGSFAVRMAEHNVTIITSTLNLNGPFNEFIALRGVVPLFLTVSQRFPFFDNTLDLVHTMHVLSNWIPKETLEFILYDIDRILRPGGLFWLDHFFCTQDQLDSTFKPMIERLKFNKIKWVTANKLDKNGVKNREVYLSALLEKPVRDVAIGSY